MRWKKLGQLYCPEPVHPKLVSHAANPLAVLLEGDVYRAFFSGRDAQNRSSVGFVDVDIVKREVVYIHDKPVFEHGSENSFYSHGVSIGNCYEADGRRYILFMGWQDPPGGHWRGDIGRLRLLNDRQLSIEPSTPFMGCDKEDSISLSYPWVIHEQGVYKMWYGSTATWDAGNGEMVHVIKYATSKDGVIWSKHGQVIPHEIGVAQAFSRPTVVVDNDGYHIWFSCRDGRGTKYRIGYAHSPDGLHWENRLHDVGIDVSSSGWDSEMIEYPFVFDHKGQRFMLYNGNDYGRTGFGLAVIEATS